VIVDKKPKAKYNKLSEHTRTLMSGDRQCAMFCGGKKCRYCISTGWSKEEMVVNGIYSHW
jgi:protein tyrosine phosphatase domain-containing protein 1